MTNTDYPINTIEEARALLSDADFQEAYRAVRQAALAGEHVSVRAETVEYPDGSETVRLVGVSAMTEDEYIQYRQNGGVWNYVDAQGWLDFEPTHIDREQAAERLAAIIEATVANEMRRAGVPDDEWELRREDVLKVAEAALDGDLGSAARIGADPEIVERLAGRSIPAPDIDTIRSVCDEVPRTTRRAPDIELQGGTLRYRFAGIERVVSDADLAVAGAAIGLDVQRAPRQLLVDAFRFQAARTFGWGLDRDVFRVEYAAELLKRWHDALRDGDGAVAHGEKALSIEAPRHPVYPDDAVILFTAATNRHRSDRSSGEVDSRLSDLDLDAEQRAVLTGLWRSFTENVRRHGIELDESRVFERFREKIRNRTPFWFVLGADDPEMAAIRDLLDRLGIPSVSALDESGKPVHPGNAYLAMPVHVSNPAIRPVVVENAARVLWRNHEITRIVVDHHRPGDFGYGKGPEQYWAASSIGQVWNLLERYGYHPERAMSEFHARVVAAGDHCPGAAYRNECPGVSRERLTRFRIRTRAAFQGISQEAYLEKVLKARDHLRRAETIKVAGHAVALLRQTVPELPEAALQEDQVFIAPVRDRGGRWKWVLQSAPPSVVERFLRDPSLGGRLFDPKKTRVESTYGDPARGFAGAVLPAGVSPSPRKQHPGMKTA